MARRLRRTVIAGGVTYSAGTAETAALREAITNPRAWDGEPDPELETVPRKSAPRKRTATKAEKPAEANPAGGETPTETPEEPPRGGEGSGEDVWRAYAVGLGLEVPEDAGRDDIVALVDARNAEQQ